MDELKSTGIPAEQGNAVQQDNAVTKSPETEFNPGWRFYLAFISLTTITLMVALDATSLSVALPIMAKLLHGSAIQVWFK
jgi:hypothetical protein